MPSGTPTLSHMPSLQPSAAPSRTPSAFPSGAPSISSAPTNIRFTTESTTGGFESVCVDTQSMSGTLQEQALAFKYNLYIPPSANAADASLSMETFLHFGMAREFLGCDFAEPASYYIISISSSPGDSVSDDACDTFGDQIPDDDEYVCVVVNAAISMSAFFPSTRRMQDTNANPDVLEDSATYLQKAMDSGDFVGENIVQVSFQGFVNVQAQGRENPGSGVTDNGGVAGIIGGGNLQADIEDSNLAAGSAVIGAAVLCFLVVVVLSVRFRNNRRESYLRHLEELSEVSELSVGDKDGTAPLSSEGKVILVMEDEDSFDGDIFEHEDIAEHDVHRCASATCPVCRTRELQPTFISTELAEASMAELRATKIVPDPRYSYQTPDTVEL